MNNLKAQGSTPILQCNHLTKVIKDGTHSTTILNQLDFSLHAEERIAIIGASGSGKSTLLHILGSLDNPTSGTVRILDYCIEQCSRQQLNQIRSRYIGFIYQFHHLLPELSLMENVAMPLLIQGAAVEIAQQKSLTILDTLGLLKRANYKPSHVSGGERQRTAIARAMITEPYFILADEPTGNLDNTNAYNAINILLTFQKTSIVIVTHDYTIARRMDKVLKLENGRLMPIDNNELI